MLAFAHQSDRAQTKIYDLLYSEICRKVWTVDVSVLSKQHEDDIGQIEMVEQMITVHDKMHSRKNFWSCRYARMAQEKYKLNGVND